MSFENSPFAASLYQAGTPKRQIIHPVDTSSTSFLQSPDSSFMGSYNTPVPQNYRMNMQPGNFKLGISGGAVNSSIGATNGNNNSSNNKLGGLLTASSSALLGLSTPSNRVVAPLFSSPASGKTPALTVTSGVAPPIGSTSGPSYFINPLETHTSNLRSPASKSTVSTLPSSTSSAASAKNSASSKDPAKQEPVETEKRVPTGSWESSVTRKIRSRVVNTELATKNLLVNFLLLAAVRFFIHFAFNQTAGKEAEAAAAVSHHYHHARSGLVSSGGGGSSGSVIQQGYRQSASSSGAAAAANAACSTSLSEWLAQYIPYEYHWAFFMVAGTSRYLVHGIQLLLLYNIVVNGYIIFFPFAKQIQDVKVTESQRQLLDLPQSPPPTSSNSNASATNGNKDQSRPESVPLYKKSTVHQRSYAGRPLSSSSSSSSSSSVVSSPVLPFASPSKSNSSVQNASFSSPVRAPAISKPTPLFGSPLKAHLMSMSPKSKAKEQNSTKNDVASVPDNIEQVLPTLQSNQQPFLPGSPCFSLFGTPASPLADLKKKINSSSAPSFPSSSSNSTAPSVKFGLSSGSGSSVGNSTISSGLTTGSANLNKDLRRRSMVAAASSAGISSSVTALATNSTSSLISKSSDIKSTTAVSNSSNEAKSLAPGTLARTETPIEGFASPKSPTFDVTGRFKYLASTPNRYRVVRDI